MSKEAAEYSAWLEEWRRQLKDKPEELAKFEAWASGGGDFTKEVFRGALRQSDYTKKTTELADARRQFEEEKASQAALHNKWKSWFDGAEVEAKRIKAENEALRRANADRDPDMPNPTSPLDPDAVRRGDLDKVSEHLKRVDAGSVNLTLAAMKVLNTAHKEGFEIDPDKLMEFAFQNNVDLTTAYHRMTESQRADRQEKDVEKRIEKAKEEAVREALKARMPDFVRGNLPELKPADKTVLTDDRDRLREGLKLFLEKPS